MAEQQSNPGPIYRFGVFQANLAARELRKHGVRVRLPGQPFCILSMLLQKPGDVITREEMQQKLWAEDTFVDFEHSLNSAIKKLRSALGDSSENSKYIETIPRVGYRFIAPVQEISEKAQVAPDASPNANPVADTSEPPKSSRWRLPAFLGIFIALIFAIGAYFQWFHEWPRTRAATGRAMLAVLPFENLTGDAGQDYFSDGLTEEMIAQLGRMNPDHLGVIARTSVTHYKHGQEQLDQIAHELGVQYVMEGSVRRDGTKVRITAQLIQIKDQTRLWARQYDREQNSLLTLQGEIAQEIADEIQLALGDSQKRIATDFRRPAVPASYEAYDLYLKGSYFWNKRTKEGFAQAADYFQQAIAKDPNYARAYAGLANTFSLMSTWLMVPQNEFMPKARDAALHALRIDPNDAEAHTALALITENYDWDWQTAEKEFKRAIALDPSYATAHQWYAEYLSWQGRFEEALAESERARQLDPFSMIIATDHAEILYYSRQYDRAIAQARAVLDMDPAFNRIRGILISAYVREGKFTEALDYIEKHQLRPDNPWAWVERVEIYSFWGRSAQAQQALQHAESLFRHSPTSGARAGLIRVYAALGLKDQAIALLQNAYAEHSNAVVAIKVDPIYDSLRSDPRFQDLLRHTGLAQAASSQQQP